MKQLGGSPNLVSERDRNQWEKRYQDASAIVLLSWPDCGELRWKNWFVWLLTEQNCVNKRINSSSTTALIQLAELVLDSRRLMLNYRQTPPVKWNVMSKPINDPFTRLPALSSRSSSTELFCFFACWSWFGNVDGCHYPPGCGLRPSVLGQDRSQTKKKSVLVLQVWCCVVKHGIVTLVVIMILKDTATFQLLFIVSLFCAQNITTVEINIVFYLKVKFVKCICLLPLVLLSWSCNQRSWS